MAKEMSLSRVRCLGDSDLVAQQVSGKWDSKDPLMAAYHREVDAVAGHFKGYQVEHIDRRKNEAADALSQLGSQRKSVPPTPFWMFYITCLLSCLRRKIWLFLTRKHS